MATNALTGLVGANGNLPNAAFGMTQGVEHPGDASFGYDDSQIMEQVTFEGGANYWPNLKNTLKVLFGVNQRTGGAKINRVPPARHPALSDMYVERVTAIKGLGRRGRDKNTGLGTYKRGVMSVVYTRRRYAIFEDQGAVTEADRFVSSESQASVFMLTLQGVEFKFPDNTPFAGTMGKRLGEVHYTYVWWNVPRLCIEDAAGRPTNLLAVSGCINSDAWLGSFTIGRLLCEGAQIRYKVSPVPTGREALAISQGSILCDVTYSLKECTPPRLTHNHFPKRGGAYDVPTAKTTGLPVYESAAFASYIFKPL